MGFAPQVTTDRACSRIEKGTHHGRFFGCEKGLPLHSGLSCLERGFTPRSAALYKDPPDLSPEKARIARCIDLFC